MHKTCMTTYQKKNVENGAGSYDNHSDSCFHWFHSIFSSKWIMQSMTINFLDLSLLSNKSRSSEISQIKLTLLLLFLLFAEQKGISSKGTIHNIMADGIFIQNSMIAESIKLWGEYINCLTITTKRTVFLILLDRGKWIF